VKKIENSKIPVVNLDTFQFSPPGPMGWSYEDYDQLLENIKNTDDSQNQKNDNTPFFTSPFLFELKGDDPPFNTHKQHQLSQETLSSTAKMDQEHTVKAETKEFFSNTSSIKEGIQQKESLSKILSTEKDIQHEGMKTQEEPVKEIPKRNHPSLSLNSSNIAKPINCSKSSRNKGKGFIIGS
jgi:hypothetical protein